MYNFVVYPNRKNTQMFKLSDKIPMQIEYDTYLKFENVNIEKNSNV